MSAPFINIHTHQFEENNNDFFSLPNIILGTDTLSTLPCSIGIHPRYISESPQEQFEELHNAAHLPQIIAIGECGLDKLCATDWQLQIQMFEQQIAIANAVQKPLIIHCVRAYQECIQILNKEKVQVPVIFHGFNKHVQLAQQLLAQGYYLSLDPILIQGKKDDLITNLPLAYLFLETDGKPIKITDVYTYFCQVRKIGLIEFKEQIDSNFKKVFKTFV